MKMYWTPEQIAKKFAEIDQKLKCILCQEDEPPTPGDEPFTELGYADPLVWDFSTGAKKFVTLGGSPVLSLVGTEDGDTGLLQVIQGAGGDEITLPGNVPEDFAWSTGALEVDVLGFINIQGTIYWSIENYGVSLTFLLDGLSPTRAYSLRKLSSSYSGAAVEIRRSLDDALADIGFDSNGDFDVAAYTAHVGAGDGFVRTWYDQSGSAQNATQTTDANQPQLELVGINSKPTIFFDYTTADKEMSYPPTIAGVSDKTNIVVYQNARADTFASAIVGQSGAAGAATWWLMMVRNSGATGHPYLACFAADLSDGTAPDANPKLATGTYDNATTTARLRSNGVEIDSNVAALNTVTTRGDIGRSSDGTITDRFGGFVSEIIFFNTDETATIPTMEINIMDYYNL
jgi:hypothetical protein